MADICPVCGEPHGKGVPNTPEVTRPRPVALKPEPIDELIIEAEEGSVEEIVEDDVPEDIDALVTSLLGEDVPEAEAEAEAPAEEEAPKDRSNMRFRELRAEAAERNITVPFGGTKAMLIELLDEDDLK